MDASELDVAILPDRLTERNQWVCWRDKHREDKPTKVPIDPQTGEFASTTDDRTWSDIGTAYDTMQAEDIDGVGFVFTETDPIVGVDLDDCRNPDTGETDKQATSIINQLASYTEVSPSGTGYHIIVAGELTGGRNRTGEVELYDRTRYFTVTGEHVDETPPEIRDRSDELTSVYDDHIVTEDESKETTAGSDSPIEAPTLESTATATLEDDELLEKAMNATNGAKFKRLWRGNTLQYNSHSEADMALCCLLAFWTGGDASRLDQLFRQSGLMRAKWDEVHYSDGSTYGEKTTERAIGTTTEVYEPAATDDNTSDTPASTSDPNGTASTEKNHAYAAEKQRVLHERIADLEAALNQRDERIETLTAERDTLREELAERDASLETLEERVETLEEGANASLWTRARRVIGTDTD